MNATKSETGVQLFARLGSKPSLATLEPGLFGPDGPQPKEVYELYGEEGSGKSQTLLHLCASCLLPQTWRGVSISGHNVGVVYMDNDYHFNMLRLTAIMEHKITAAFQVEKNDKSCIPSDEEVETLVKQCLTKLYLVRCNSSSQFVITLHKLESLFSSKPNMCVLMIDSISAFYWIDRSNGGDNYQAQEANLTKATDAINQIKNSYKLVVFVTKSAIYQKKQRDNTYETSGENQLPSCERKQELSHSEYLCRAWQKIVNQRWIFSKKMLMPKDCEENSLFNVHFNIHSDRTLKYGYQFETSCLLNESGLQLK